MTASPQFRWLYRYLSVSLITILLLLSQQANRCAAQAQGEESTTGTVVDLPFGDINVLVLTDVHSWLGGHGQNEPLHNADYGDVLSFYRRLKDYCRRQNMDLWFVVNGDWIDGTGLSLNDDISYLTPLLERMPWDALNVGNHELYRSDVIHEFMRPGGFVESWGDRYISSNVLYTQRQSPLGVRFKYLKGENSTLLTFGFLYNMLDASPAVTVETIESVVEEQWFIEAVGASNLYDAILVMAHMDVKDALVSVVLDKIRSIVGSLIPVQFLTGHTHYRGINTLDEASESFEAGRFLDTIGFVSFPKKQTLVKISNNRKLQGSDEGERPPLFGGPGGMEWQNASEANENNTASSSAATIAPATKSPSTKPPTTLAPTIPQPISSSNNTSTASAANNTPAYPPMPSTTTPTAAPTHLIALNFEHRFIDTDVATLEAILGVSDLATEDGARLSEFITRTRQELGLLEVVGCAPNSYFVDQPVENEYSLWRLFLLNVAPFRMLQPTSSAGPNQQRMLLADTGGLRYDVADGQLIKDDVIAVAPFNDTMFSIGPEVPGSVVIQLVAYLNAATSVDNPKFDNFVLSPSLEEIQPDVTYEILVAEFAAQKVLEGFDEINYNRTVSQTDSGFRSTDVWLDYIESNWKCKHHETSPPGHGQGGGSHHTEGGSSSQGGSSGSSSSGSETHSGTPYIPGGAQGADRFRMTLAAIGIGSVLLLGSVYIWTLHRSYMIRYQDRQRVILLVDRANDNELI